MLSIMRVTLQLRRATKNYDRLIICPPPRKSLVKGERFIRSEGKPEILYRTRTVKLIYCQWLVCIVGLYSQQYLYNHINTLSN